MVLLTLASPFMFAESAVWGIIAWEGWRANLISEESREVQTSDVETSLVSGSNGFLGPA